jgi:hypothetical protein
MTVISYYHGKLMKYRKIVIFKGVDLSGRVG